MCADRKRCLMVGAGGMATVWIDRFFPEFDRRSQIVALVDVDEKVLHARADDIGLSNEARFTDLRRAFAEVEADYCTIVTPPWVHRACVEAACRRGMAILTEKPIADSWRDVVAICRAVRRARVKCTVIQNYRYDPTMYTFRALLRQERLGRLNYIMGKFMGDYRRYGSLGTFHHKMPHALLVEGAVHHLDMLRNLAGSHCVAISGYEWNRPWSSFDGESNANYVMKMANGVIAHYEGSCSAAGKQNNWHHEYYRAECEKGQVEVDNDGVVRTVVRDNKSGRLTTQEIPLQPPRFVGHNHVIDAHLRWMGGGAKPETALDDNIHSNAAIFAAIEASRRGTSVDVEAMVKKATSGSSR